jgi:hypothetical protein
MKSSEPQVSQKGANPHPYPLAKRVCKCGCGHSFQPKRHDQVYLNSQHANYGYNHGVRKEKLKSTKLLNKILAKNDQILGKHLRNRRANEATCSKFSLQTDGFEFMVYTGRANTGEFLIYNFCYQYETVGKETIIRIKRIS